jgi:hypothetical protein
MRRFDWDNVHLFIACVGMADAWMWSFEVDGVWGLEHGRPGAMLIPWQIDGSRPVGVDEVLFMADCIAFDHDMPTVIRPNSQRADAEVPLVEPVVAFPGDKSGLWYFQQLEAALGIASELRVGAALELRYDDDAHALTAFTARFRGARKPLALYAMATRQLDWTSEYLCLYRVLEWLNKDNGLEFIRDHLDEIHRYDFGTLKAQKGLHSYDDSVDVFATYRQRAEKYIYRLRAQGQGASDIARGLYAIRNGLAHGKNDFLLSDFGDDVSRVADALPVVKLLARIVVEHASDR